MNSCVVKDDDLSTSDQVTYARSQDLCLQVLAWCGGAILLSMLSYPLMQLARERQWCKFVGSSPHEFKSQLRGQLTSARTSYNSLASAQDVADLHNSPDIEDDPHQEHAALLGEDLGASPNGVPEKGHVP